MDLSTGSSVGAKWSGVKKFHIRFEFWLRKVGGGGRNLFIRAEMAELVDAPDLGSGIFGCAGSIPVLGIF